MACPGHWLELVSAAYTRTPPAYSSWPRSAVVVAGTGGYAVPACGSCSGSSPVTAARRSISTRSLSSAWSAGPIEPVPSVGRHVCKGGMGFVWNSFRDTQRSHDCGVTWPLSAHLSLTGTRTCRRCTCLNRRSRLRSFWDGYFGEISFAWIKTGR